MTEKKISSKKQVQDTKTVDGLEKLSSFVKDNHPSFHYNRVHWKNEGPRVGISDAIHAKVKPKGHEAYWFEVLLPEAASGRYKQIDTLLSAYDSLPPRDSTAYVDYKIILDPDLPWARDWELVRAWAFREFVKSLSVAAVLIHHVPELSGSVRPPHIHTLVLPRKLGVNGFGSLVTPLGSDVGFDEAKASWLSWAEQTTAPA